MTCKFYDINGKKLGKAEELYLYSVLNIEIDRLSEQEKYDQLVNKLESLKMNNGTITLEDDTKLKVNELDKMEMRHHNLSKAKTFTIH